MYSSTITPELKEAWGWGILPQFQTGEAPFEIQSKGELHLKRWIWEKEKTL